MVRKNEIGLLAAMAGMVDDITGKDRLYPYQRDMFTGRDSDWIPPASNHILHVPSRRPTRRLTNLGWKSVPVKSKARFAEAYASTDFSFMIRRKKGEKRYLLYIKGQFLSHAPSLAEAKFKFRNIHERFVA